MDAAGDDPVARVLAVFDLLAEQAPTPSFRGCAFLNAAAHEPNRDHPAHEALREHKEHARGLFREHKEHARGLFREHKEHARGLFREQAASAAPADPDRSARLRPARHGAWPSASWPTDSRGAGRRGRRRGRSSPDRWRWAPAQERLTESPDPRPLGPRASWLPPERLDRLVDRWINLARGEPKAADAVEQFACTTSVAWQTTTGLTWLERLVDSRYDRFAGQVWFVTHWLTELREATSLGAKV